MTDDDDNSDKKPPVPVVVPERTAVGTWKPGQSGNPRGKPLGARTKFIREIVELLGKSWHERGREVVTKVINEHPVEYLKICARLIPRDVHLTQHDAASSLSEEAVNELLEQIRKEIAAKKAKLIEGSR